MPFMIISLIATMASAAASARAQYVAGKQQQKNAEYNAAIQEDAADEEEAIRAIESVEERNQSRKRLSSMEARYAKSGVLMAGTPELFMQKQAEADEFNILSRDRVSGIRTQNLRTEADLMRRQGKDARKAGKTGAFTTLLTGAASAAGTAYDYQSKVGERNKGGTLTSNSLMPPPRMDTLSSGGLSYGPHNNGMFNNG